MSDNSGRRMVTLSNSYVWPVPLPDNNKYTINGVSLHANVARAGLALLCGEGCFPSAAVCRIGSVFRSGLISIDRISIDQHCIVGQNHAWFYMHDSFPCVLSCLLGCWSVWVLEVLRNKYTRWKIRRPGLQPWSNFTPKKCDGLLGLIGRDRVIFHEIFAGLKGHIWYDYTMACL